MAVLYVITGPAGVGKSTISLKVAKMLEKSALIEGDDIYGQVVGGSVSPWKEGNHLELFWRISINTIREYLKAGYDVVFNYIISPQNLEKIKEAFGDEKIKFVVLLADEETILQRDKLRPEDCQMGERCVVLLHHFEEYIYDERFIVDTGKIGADEVIDMVIDKQTSSWLWAFLFSHQSYRANALAIKLVPAKK